MTRQEKVNLLNELMGIEEKNDIGNLTSTDRQEFQQWVEELEQEPKTGHWIKGKYKDDDIRYNDSSYKCDKCGKIVDFKENYCPNCGAKMVEPQESEEE